MFKTVGHTVARQVHGQVVALTSCGGQVTPNFHVGELRLRSGVWFLLCSASHPWLAAVARLPTWTEESFVNPPGVQEAVELTSSFRFLRPDELETPLTLEAWGALGDEELGPLLDWKPERLGDVIFNFWD